MNSILEQPFGENQAFSAIIENQMSLVVFVRHPG
jgi:hypothetical protein